MCKTGHDLSHKSVFQKHILKVNLQQNFMIFFRQPDTYIDKMLRVFTKLQLKTMVTPELTVLMSTSVLRPHPRHPVLNGFIKGIGLRWKTWFKHRSPARHRRGWHSYIIDRFIQCDSGPHGASSSGWQLHCGIASNWGRLISMSPIGTLTYRQQHRLVLI